MNKEERDELQQLLSLRHDDEMEPGLASTDALANVEDEDSRLFQNWLAETQPEFSAWREARSAIAVPDVKSALVGIRSAIAENRYVDLADSETSIDADWEIAGNFGGASSETRSGEVDGSAQSVEYSETAEKAGKVIAFPNRRILTGIAAAAAAALFGFLLINSGAPDHANPVEFSMTEVEDAESGVEDADVMVITTEDGETMMILIESEETFDIEGLL